VFLLFFLLISSLVSVTRDFPRPLPREHSQHMPNTKRQPARLSFCVRRRSFALQHRRTGEDTHWCRFLFGVFGVVPSPYSTPRPRKDTLQVSFCVRRCTFALKHTPNMKRHQRGCLFVFGVVPLLFSTRRARNTLVGVVSCSASFLHPTAHATEHDVLLALVFFVHPAPLRVFLLIILCIVKYLLFILNQYI
jgi:hypothetical protein